MSIYEEKIKNFMTKSPHTVSMNQNLQFATDKMKEFNVRHLPVLQGGKLVGILSERDIRFVESFDKLDPKDILVEDAYTDDPLIVESSTTLKVACKEMVSRKIGSILVQEDSELTGIFTWIDALKLLSQENQGENS